MNYVIVVSILVLMDSSFQLGMIPAQTQSFVGFNPCFNGFFFSIISTLSGTDKQA